MKKILLLLLCNTVAAFAITTPADKVPYNPNTKQLLDDIVVGPGHSLTISGGSVSGFGGSWGSITGTLSLQTDLATALAGKVPTTRNVAGHALSGDVTLASADISDATANGRSLLTATNYAAMKSLLSITAADISDASASGRSLLTAADYATMRSLLSAVSTTRTINGYPLSADVTLTATDVGLASLAVTPTSATPPPLESLTFKQWRRKPWIGFLDEKFIIREINGIYPTTTEFSGQFQVTITKPDHQNLVFTPTGSSWSSGTCAPTNSFEIPFFGVEATIVSLPTGGSNNLFQVGLYAAGPTTYIYAELNVNTLAFKIHSQLAGGIERISTGVTLPAVPYRMGLAISDRYFGIWYQLNANSAWVLAECITPTDNHNLTAPATLATYQPVVAGAGTGTTGSVVLTSIRTGYLKGIGLANFSQVVRSSGDPLFVAPGRKIVCIANKSFGAPDGGAYSVPSVQNACAGLFTVDMDSGDIECIAMLNTLRSGVLYGENSGCGMYDETTGQFTFLIPSWGSISAGSVDIYAYQTQILPRGTTILTGGTIVAVPTSAATGSHYDPHLLRVGANMQLMYSRTSARTMADAHSFLGVTFHPVLAQGPSLSSLSLLVDGTTLTGGEGNKIVKWGSTYRYLCTSPSAGVVRVLDSNFNLLGTLTSPWIMSAGLVIHPAMFPVYSADGTSALFWIGHIVIPYSGAVTGTMDFGDLSIAKSTTTWTGSNYSLLPYLY